MHVACRLALCFVLRPQIYAVQSSQREILRSPAAALSVDTQHHQQHYCSTQIYQDSQTVFLFLLRKFP